MFFLFLSICLHAQNATIEKTWLEHGTVENGVQGMKIHAKFHLSNAKGVPCEMTVFFYNSEYKPWKGLDSRYCCALGYVSNRTDYETCYACHGTGRCPGCNGTGDMGDSYNFHKEKIVMRCSSCSGSGKCLSCHGKGRVVKFGGY